MSVSSPLVANARGYFPALTALRGIAALGVVLFHAQAKLPQLAQQIETPAFALGYMWVDLFFILSGFVLAYRYSQDFAENIGPAGVWRFVAARFAKIYPAYVTVLLALVVLEFLARDVAVQQFGGAVYGMFFNGAYSVPALVSNVFLVQSMGLHDQLTWNMPGWSLSAEWMVYLVAPLLLWQVRRWRWAVVVVVPVLMLVGLLSLQLALGKQNLNFTYDFGAVRCFLEFTLGLALFRLFGQATVKKVCGQDISVFVATVGLLAAFYWGATSLLVVALFAVVVLCVASSEGWIVRQLAWRPLIWLGTISYSVYLGQWLVFRCLHLYVAIYQDNNLQSYFSVTEARWLVMAIVLACLGLGWSLYAAIEKPMQRRVLALMVPRN